MQKAETKVSSNVNVRKNKDIHHHARRLEEEERRLSREAFPGSGQETHLRLCPFPRSAQPKQGKTCHGDVPAEDT